MAQAYHYRVKEQSLKVENLILRKPVAISRVNEHNKLITQWELGIMII